MAKRKRSNTKKKNVRKAKVGLRKAIRRVLLGVAETKYYSYNQENFQLYHNAGVAGGIVVRGNMLGTTQLITEEGRIGDKVQAVGLSIKLMLFNKNDRPNVTYRIIVFTCPVDQYLQNLPALFWEGNSGNKILDNINTNRFKVIKEKFVQVQGQTTAWVNTDTTKREKSKALQMYIPLKGRTIAYSAEEGSVPKYQRDILQLAVIAYDAYGTLTTDNIASMAYMTKFYFKDI